MNKYIVAYISFFDNVLKQTPITADSHVEAALKYLLVHENIKDIPDVPNLESLGNWCFDCDSTIQVIEI
jgi:hypothetical protein